LACAVTSLIGCQFRGRLPLLGPLATVQTIVPSAWTMTAEVAHQRYKVPGVPAARILPPYMITIQLQVVSASGRMCVEMSTVCVPARPLINCLTSQQFSF